MHIFAICKRLARTYSKLMNKTLPNALVTILACAMAIGCTQPKKNSAEATAREVFVDSLMESMTLDEMIGQLNLIDGGALNTGNSRKGVISKDIAEGKVGGFLSVMGQENIREAQRIAVEESRLGIPLLFGLDVIHGYRTIFPIPLALAATWDTAAVREAAAIAAKEATADGLNWTFSPMVDIARDARWGRVAESAGEDPLVASAMARAFVEGYQGDLCGDDKMLACAKHFGLYGASEAGKDYNPVDMSRIRMFNEYLPPYEAAVRAGVGSVMSSFNTVDYVPAVGNKWLMSNVLRDMWDFSGFVVTDYGSIGEMSKWGIEGMEKSAVQCLEAGNDMDMCSKAFVRHLSQAVEEGTVSASRVRTACRRILEAKYDLGLFADPHKHCKAERLLTDIYTAEHRATARRIAAESMVLLKNDGNLLPLRKGGRIAVIGPMADNGKNMLGCWTHCADTANTHFTSLVEAIRKATDGQAQVFYAKGSNVYLDAKKEANACAFATGMRDGRSPEQMIAEAFNIAKKADIVIMAIGETREMTGESASRTDLELPDAQMDLLRKIVETGKPIVAVYSTGRPVVMEWERTHIPAILNIWFGGSEAAEAVADVLFGDAEPTGRLTVTFPRATGQVPLYYAHLNTGRPLAPGKWFSKYVNNYIDVEEGPAYPFGFGLSYTTFEYSKMVVEREKIKMGDSLRVSVDVSNTGERTGHEVVQLYVHDVYASIARPVKELKAYRRIELKPGETKTVRLSVSADDLGYYMGDGTKRVEPGDFEVFVGGNSRDVLTSHFTLTD